MRRLLVLPLLALPLVGCASTSVEGGRDPAELEEMKARVLALQRQAAVADVEIERLRRQVAELEVRLAGGAEVRPVPTSPAVASPAPTAEAVPPPVLLDDDVASPPPSVVEEEDLETAALPSVEPLASEVPAEAPVAAAPPGAEALEAISSAAQAVYDRGYTLYHQGRYVDAETSFQEFLRDHPATELTDNAQYWIGECRFARGEIEGALDAFRETAERYPAGNKVPDALVKMGDCLRALGDEAGALARYQEVLDRFPGTGASAMAEARLP